ncbi:MAG: hypothetical protein CBC48_05410 [bacterium TMED88]|nr:MAG: hypothetical protein CBC48_05410 [bacterium TMED88]
MEPITFKLNEFKQVAKWIDKTFPFPIAFILKGWLWKLEDYYIVYKIKNEVDEAIAPHIPDDPVVEPPTYHTEASEVEGLDTISISGTWDRS